VRPALTGMGDEIQAVVDAQGWDATSLMDLALTYIARQGDDSAFLDYLRECAAEENEAEDERDQAEPNFLTTIRLEREHREALGVTRMSVCAHCAGIIGADGPGARWFHLDTKQTACRP